MARQLRTVKEGETVKLDLHSATLGEPWVVEATLVSREGSGDDEVLHFTDVGDLRNTIWNVYRFKNRWAWGTGANRIGVHEDNPKPRQRRPGSRPVGRPRKRQEEKVPA